MNVQGQAAAGKQGLPHSLLEQLQLHYNCSKVVFAVAATAASGSSNGKRTCGVVITTSGLQPVTARERKTSAAKAASALVVETPRKPPPLRLQL